MWPWLQRLLGRPAPKPAEDPLSPDSLTPFLADPARRPLVEDALRKRPELCGPVLERALRDPNPAVQKAGLHLLGELGGPESIDGVLTAFELDASVRGACLQTLSALLRRHGEAAAARLRPVLDDTTPQRTHVRKQVRSLLEQNGLIEGGAPA